MTPLLLRAFPANAVSQCYCE